MVTLQAPSCVAINLVANYNFLWIPLAREIKERFGSYVVGVCQTMSDKRWFEKQDRSGVIDAFFLTERLNEQYGDISESAERIKQKARDFEEKYGCVYPDIIQTDRHLGRGCGQ